MPSRSVRASIAKQVSDAWRLTAGAGMTNPLTEISWYSAFWAGDPAWSAPADGAAVSTWRNGGTLGTAATQGTGASQPTFRSSNSTLNNRPVVDFDGTDDRLEITTGVSLAQPFSVVWIGTLDAIATRMIVGVNSASSGRGVGIATTPTNVFLDCGTALRGGTPTTATGYLVRAYANGVSSAITLNGTAAASGTANTGGVDQIIIGAGRTAPSTYGLHVDGKTAFLGIYSGDITTHARWSDFKAWTRSHYGLTIA